MSDSTRFIRRSGSINSLLRRFCVPDTRSIHSYSIDEERLEKLISYVFVRLNAQAQSDIVTDFMKEPERLEKLLRCRIYYLKTMKMEDVSNLEKYIEVFTTLIRRGVE